MWYEINYELDQGEFKNSIRRMIREAIKSKAVLPLPIYLNSDNASNIITSIISQVNCDGCNAPCCKSNPNGEPLDMALPEYENLSGILGKEVLSNKGIKLVGNWAKVPMPCPFLKNDKCSIYQHRPLVCILYPLEKPSTDQSGRSVLSLAAVCPEARRMVKAAHMYYWRIIRKMDELGPDYITNKMKGGK